MSDILRCLVFGVCVVCVYVFLSVCLFLVFLVRLVSFGSQLLFVGISEELVGNCQNLRKFRKIRNFLETELVEALIVSEKHAF